MKDQTYQPIDKTVAEYKLEKAVRAARPVLWDKFAMAALTALVAKNDGVMFPEQISERACDYADAMMEEKEKRSEPPSQEKI